MFHSARLKLTAWYLLIIMCVSIAFSGVIYRMLTLEFDRFARLQRYRIEHRFDIGISPLLEVPQYELPPTSIFDESIITEAKQHLMMVLAAINVGVFVFAGGLGYFLAGRTLKPIQDMVDEQHRFISDASHELRTPLTALKSSMEVNLRDPKLTLTDAKTLMKESISDVNKLQSLSDSLLQLAQYQTPANIIKFTTVQLEHMIQSVIHKLDSLAKQKNIVIKYESSPVKIEANEYGLMDLLIILLDNAIKYSPRNSSITIQSKRTDGMVALTISDQGTGIAEKDIPHIFDRFYRADMARSKQTAGGYGLGLSIAKQIVTLHQGTITVESTMKKGSTFTVRLPVKQSRMNLS
jgi:signal transduction histidine kinase